MACIKAWVIAIRAASPKWWFPSPSILSCTDLGINIVSISKRYSNDPDLLQHLCMRSANSLISCDGMPNSCNAGREMLRALDSNSSKFCSWPPWNNAILAILLNVEITAFVLLTVPFPSWEEMPVMPENGDVFQNDLGAVLHVWHVSFCIHRNHRIEDLLPFDATRSLTVWSAWWSPKPIMTCVYEAWRFSACSRQNLHSIGIQCKNQSYSLWSNCDHPFPDTWDQLA